MADERAMELLKTYPGDLPAVDHAYSEREADIRWQSTLSDPVLNPSLPYRQEAEAGAGAATPEQVGAVPVPRGTPEQPSAFAVGAQAAMRSAAEAAKSAMEGLGKAFLPGVAPGGAAEAEVAKAGTRGPVAQMAGEVVGGLADKVAGVKQALMEGVLSLGMAPFVGLGAGAGQALMNANPELADTEVMDPFQASFVRMMLGQGNPLDRDESPEGQARRAALHQPMTLKEAVDLALTTAPMWVPAAAGAVKAGVRQSVKIRQRMKEQLPNILSERGSLRAFHGSPDVNLTTASANPAGRQFDNATSVLGAFFTPDIQDAQRYAGKTGRVYPADVNLTRPYEMRWGEFGKFQDITKTADRKSLPPEQWGARMEELKAEAAALRAKLEGEGYDGIIVRNTKGQPVEIASFHDVPLGERKAAKSRGAVEEPPPDLGTQLDLNDPASIAAFVHTHGGLAHDPALAGEFKRIPVDLKRKGGQRWDVIAQQAGVDPQEFLNALTNLEVLRRQKRERLAEAKRAMDQEWEGYEPSEQQLAEQKATQDAIDLWDAMEAESAHGQPEPTGGPAERPSRQGAGTPSPGPPEGGAGGGQVPGETLPGGALRASAGGTAAAGPEVGAPSTSRLNVGRVNAPERVKALLTELNEAAGRTLEAHRRPITHEQTVAEGRALSLDQVMLADPAQTSIEGGRAVQQGLRDYLNATGRKLEALIRAGDDPEAVADLTGLGIYLARLDERFGAGFARGLEARKILSEDVTPGGGAASKTPKRERTVAAGLTPDNLTYLGETVGLDPVTLGQQAAQQDALAAQVANLRAAAGLPTHAPRTTSVAELVMASMRAQLDRAVSPEALLAMLRALTRPQVKTWMQSIGSSAQVTRDVLHTLWINSLLTNPVTHTVNLFGTGTAMAWDVVERGVAAQINKWFRHDPEGVQTGEAMRMLAHPIMAIEDGIRLVGRAYQEQRAPFEKGWGSGKAETPRITAAEYGWASDTLHGAAIDVLGAALDNPYMPTKGLLYGDAFMKGIAKRGELNAQALVQVTREARAAEGEGKPMSPEAYAERLKALEVHPTPEMLKASEDYSVQITLNKQLGPVGTALTTALNNSVLGRWIVPFVRWSGNAASWMGQRAPLTGEISAIWGKNNADLNAGGRLRDQAIARMVVGHSVFAVIAYNVYAGNLSGSGSMTKEQAGYRWFRECPAYSAKVGGTCAPANYVRTLGAPGQLVGAAADWMELTREIPNQEWADEWVAQSAAVIMALGNTFVNQTAMQGLSQLLEEIKDPLGAGGAMGRGFARSAVPAAVRAVTRTQDENVIREVKTMADAFRSGLPWSADKIPVKRHPITGKGLTYPAGVGPDLVSPVFWATPNADPVDKEIIDNKVKVTQLPWTMGGSQNPGDTPRLTEPLPGEGVRLRPDERDDWITHMTQDKVDGQQTLHQALTNLIKSPEYRDQPPGPGRGRDTLILKTVQAYRSAGLNAMLEEPRHADLRARYEKALNTKGSAYVPMSDPSSPANDPSSRLYVPPSKRGAPLGGGVLPSLGR